MRCVKRNRTAELVAVSSILPAVCEPSPVEIGVATLQPGRNHVLRQGARRDDEPGRRIGASIGLARPKSPTFTANSEHHGFGVTNARAAMTPRSRSHDAGVDLGIDSIPTPPGTSARRVYETVNSSSKACRSPRRRRAIRKPLDLRRRGGGVPLREAGSAAA